MPVDRHPRFAGKHLDHPPYPAVAAMPILDREKRFTTCNESTVCNTEYAPGHFKIVIGMSHHASPLGAALPMSIAETEALIALLQNAIADQRRMEAGKAPIAREGKQSLQ